MQKQHIIKCATFSTAYDICCLLDTIDITYNVTTCWHPDKFGCGWVEFEIRYSYVVEGDD